MNRNKKIIYIMVVLLAVIAGWLYFENSSGKEVRAMGFPSIRAVPDGFNYAEAKSIDTGDDHSGIFSQAIEDDFQRLLAYLIGRFCDPDGSFCGSKRFVSGKKSKALSFIMKKHCS